MNISLWTPFRELENLLSGYRAGTVGQTGGENNSQIAQSELGWRPASDIIESESDYTIRAALPDVKREDINVSVESGVIRIDGERRLEKRSSDETLHRTESLYGSFFRSFVLPKNADSDAISATYKDGVLDVRVPKTQSASVETRKIRID